MSMITNSASISVAQAGPDARATFIRRTYGHLAVSIAAFAGLLAYLIRSPLAEAMLRFIGSSQYSWLMIMGAFILVGWLGRGLAHNVASPGLQYLGLAFYVVAEAIVFVPLVYIAVYFSSPSVLPTAAIMTGALFLGLTAIAFTTRTDFSFMRSMLTVGGCVALGLIVCSIVFGFELGLLFSFGMVVLATGAILYDTSRIMYHYPTGQHVAAALELFASVALLFWYVLRIMMRMSRR